MTRPAGLDTLLAVADHQAAGETGTPAALLGHPLVVPTANGAYPPDPAGIARPAGEPETALSARQEHALVLLLSGSTLSATARLLGVRRQTVSDWTRLPAFARELRRQRTEMLSGALQQLSGLVAQSVQALQDGLHPDQDINVRIRAGIAVLQLVGVAHARLIDAPDLAPVGTLEGVGASSRLRRDRAGGEADPGKVVPLTAGTREARRA